MVRALFLNFSVDEIFQDHFSGALNAPLACIPADDNDVCTSSSNSYNPTISASIETLLSHPSDILSTPKKFDARPCLMGLLTLLQPCLYQIQSTE